MKVTLVMVSSINGKITNGDKPDRYHWTSGEDEKLNEKGTVHLIYNVTK